MRLSALALALGLVLGGSVAEQGYAQAATAADTQHELDQLASQEAALTAWLADVETIRAAADPAQRGIYTPDYVAALQRSLAAVREKREALAQRLKTETPPPGGTSAP
jgi:hypothetical protein